jgi:hypothetical protein
MFKWICLSLAVVFGLAILGLIYDLKQDVTASLTTAQAAVAKASDTVTTVNAQLPEIVTEVKKGTETLSDLAEDVALLKRVAGVENSSSDRGVRGLVTYADDLQRMLAQETEGKEAVILIEEIFGSKLKQTATAEEFLIGLHKEMVTLILPLAKSKEEVLYRACTSSPPRRKPFYIQFPGEEPKLLEVFLREHHPASADLPEYMPKPE